MAKLSFLGDVVCAALFMSVILWQETSSSSLGPFSSTVIEETTTTKGRGCIGFECPYYGLCVVDSDNRPSCVCPQGCPRNYLPVCGSDNKTYTHECVLRSLSCRTSTTITVLYPGSCDEGPDGCANVTCPLGKHCVMNKTENRPECVCNIACYLLYAPVCGSDGKTYDNDCFLGMEACKTNTNNTIAHYGSCNDTCIGFECPRYWRCVADSDNRPTCVCPSGCPRNIRPVCSSYNETYDNECLLQSKACETKTNITVVHEGKCGDGVSEATVTASSTHAIPSDQGTKKP